MPSYPLGTWPGGCVKWRRQADKLPPLKRETSGVCAGRHACRFVHETAGNKWLENQIWSGMRGCPRGKHQVWFVCLLLHVLEILAGCDFFFFFFGILRCQKLKCINSLAFCWKSLFQSMRTSLYWYYVQQSV